MAKEKKNVTQRSEKKSAEEMEHEAQMKYLQLQLIKQQLMTFMEEKKIIDEKAEEIKQTIQTLNSMNGVAKNSQMWTPLGSGTFAKSEIKDTEKVLIGVGAGAAVLQERGSAARVLEDRKKDLEKLSTEIISNVYQLSEKAESIENDLNKLIEKLQH